MIFKDSEDWKDFLSEDSREALADIFRATRRHKGAYMNADDVKVAQLWCAMIELRKEFNRMSELLKRIEGPFKAIVAIGEAEKKKAIEKVITEIIRPTDEGEKDATRRLVESLMKF